MKIIDFKRKGNLVRFYLGKDQIKEWWGDDWDDAPYEHNAGPVYEEYVSGYRDIVFPFDTLVLEPMDTMQWNGGTEYSKADMLSRRIPCIVAIPRMLAGTTWHDDFDYWKAADGVKKYYFGDAMEPSERIEAN